MGNSLESKVAAVQKANASAAQNSRKCIAEIPPVKDDRCLSFHACAAARCFLERHESSLANFIPL
jgi:hypothetical protein